jgi:hypothetical protein
MARQASPLFHEEPEIIQSLAREYGWPGFAPTEYVEAEVDPKIYQFDF